MNNRLCAYRIMWVFVYFDLPTETKQDRKDYALFRKNLLKMGFDMLQYSIYARCCPSWEAADSMAKNVEYVLPPYGNISIMMLTDKQFSRIKNFYGAERMINHKPPDQILMF